MSTYLRMLHTTLHFSSFQLIRVFFTHIEGCPFDDQPSFFVLHEDFPAHFYYFTLLITLSEVFLTYVVQSALNAF